MRLGFGLSWVLVACAGAPEPAPSPAAPPVPPQTRVVEPAAPSEGSALHVMAGDAVPVQLRFTTVGKLHQGFFGRPELVRKLGRGLGACTTHTVDVDVVWSQAELEGRIVAVLPVDSTTCRPRLDGDVLDLTPLQPVSRGVAAYRDGVAGTSDFRIANFVAAVDLVAEGQVCRLRAAGQHPPDGTRFDPCVSVNGAPVCARGSSEIGVERLVFDNPKDLAKVRRCL
jgi:hypothetical protein